MDSGGRDGTLGEEIRAAVSTSSRSSQFLGGITV